MLLLALLLFLVQIQTRTTLIETIPGINPQQMAFTLDGEHLWVATQEGGILQLDGETLKVIAEPAPRNTYHTTGGWGWGRVEGMGADPSGKYLVVSGLSVETNAFRRILEVRDSRTGKLLAKDDSTWPVPRDSSVGGREAVGPFFLPNNGSFIIIDPYGGLELRSLPNLKLLQQFKDPNGVRRGLIFSPDGHLVAFQGVLGPPFLYLWPSLESIDCLPDYDPRRWRLGWSPEGQLLSLSGRMAVERIQGIPPTYSGRITDPTFAAKSKDWVQIVTDPESINLVSLKSMKRIHRLQGGKGRNIKKWLAWGVQRTGNDYFGHPILRPDGKLVCYTGSMESGPTTLKIWRPSRGN